MYACQDITSNVPLQLLVWIHITFTRYLCNDADGLVVLRITWLECVHLTGVPVEVEQ